MSGSATAGAQGHTESATQQQGQQPAGEQTQQQQAGEQGKGSTEQKAGEQGKTAEQTQQSTQQGGTEQGKETPGKAGEQPKAPEKYALTVPDSGQAFVDDKVLAQVEGMARKAGWSNDDAQNALNEHIETMRALSESFLTETKADQDYGGEKLAETQQLAKAAIDKIRPAGHPRRESFLKFLNRFGGSNHLDVVSFLADVGRLMAEDQPGATRVTSGKDKSAESLLYDKTPVG